MRTVPASLLPLVPLFCRSLTQMGTAKESFIELTERMGRKTGGLSIYPFTSPVRGKEDPVAYVMVGGGRVVGGTGQRGVSSGTVGHGWGVMYLCGMCLGLGGGTGMCLGFGGGYGHVPWFGGGVRACVLVGGGGTGMCLGLGGGYGHMSWFGGGVRGGKVVSLLSLVSFLADSSIDRRWGGGLQPQKTTPNNMQWLAPLPLPPQHSMACPPTPAPLPLPSCPCPHALPPRPSHLTP